MRMILPPDLRGKGIPYSDFHIRRLEAKGLFPRRVRLVPGGKHTGWPEPVIDEWIASREPLPMPERPEPGHRYICAMPGCGAEFQYEPPPTGGPKPKYCEAHRTTPKRKAAKP